MMSENAPTQHAETAARDGDMRAASKGSAFIDEPAGLIEHAPVMEVAQAGFHYHRARPVLRDVSASLAAGRVTALIGPNAAGKSTLVRLMLGALSPTRGRVTLAGLEVAKLRPIDRARWVSYVPQRAGVRFGFTVRQTVAMGRHAAGDAHQRGAELASLLADADLSEVADRPFAHLSGGQQQRVLLARAQAQAIGGGRVMLLDEPASNLDLRHAHTTMLRLRALAAQGLAVLVVVHDLNLALRYADDCWLLDHGKLIAAGPWHDVLTPDVLAPVYGVALRYAAPESEDPTGRPALIVGPGENAATMPQASHPPDAEPDGSRSNA